MQVDHCILSQYPDWNQVFLIFLSKKYVLVLGWKSFCSSYWSHAWQRSPLIQPCSTSSFYTHPIGTLIPICNGCRNADCIKCWVIKLGASTLSRLHNQWHFPMETTTRLQSICSPNLIKQLTRSSLLCFIPCTLGDMENMSSTFKEWHTHTYIYAPMRTDTNCMHAQALSFLPAFISTHVLMDMLHYIHK